MMIDPLDCRNISITIIKSELMVQFCLSDEFSDDAAKSGTENSHNLWLRSLAVSVVVMFFIAAVILATYSCSHRRFNSKLKTIIYRRFFSRSTQTPKQIESEAPIIKLFPVTYFFTLNLGISSYEFVAYTNNTAHPSKQKNNLQAVDFHLHNGKSMLIFLQRREGVHYLKIVTSS